MTFCDVWKQGTLNDTISAIHLADAFEARRNQMPTGGTGNSQRNKRTECVVDGTEGKKKTSLRLGRITQPSSSSSDESEEQKSEKKKPNTERGRDGVTAAV